MLDENFSDLDLTTIDGKGKFISWLANGKYFSVHKDEDSSEYIIYSTETLKPLMKVEGNPFSFYYKSCS